MSETTELSDDALHALAERVGTTLQASHLMLATAESCTGGWIAKMVTDIPGCSAWFDCGMAAYSYEAKQALLGVRPETLVEHRASVEGANATSLIATRWRMKFLRLSPTVRSASSAAPSTSPASTPSC